MKSNESLGYVYVLSLTFYKDFLRNFLRAALALIGIFDKIHVEVAGGKDGSLHQRLVGLGEALWRRRLNVVEEIEVVNVVKVVEVVEEVKVIEKVEVVTIVKIVKVAG